MQLISGNLFRGTTFVAPQVLVDVNHSKCRSPGQDNVLKIATVAMEVMMVGLVGIRAPKKLKLACRRRRLGP